METNIKILVVDDDWTNRKLMSACLKKVSNCDEADDGMLGIQKFQSALEAGEKYDLLFLDIIMPGINGIEVVKLIREIEGKFNIPGSDGVKIILCTSLDKTNSIADSLNSGYEGYLVKPISKGALFDEMEKFGFRCQSDKTKSGTMSSLNI